MTQETSEAEASRGTGVRFGVRSLLFLVLGTGAVLPVTLLGLNQAERWTAHEMASADRETLAAVRSAADQVSSAMLAHVHDSESFAAQVATLPRLERSLLEPVMDAHVAHHPEFLGAYVADAQGRSLVHESAARQFYDGGREYADRDYYQEIAPDRLRVFLADATAHGVQASMRTIVLKAAYDRLRPLHAAPASLLAALNAYLVYEFPDGDLHCTACCLDLVLGASFVEVVYANGGNPPLFVFSPQGGYREVYAEGPLLGAEHLTWPAPETLRLEPGELLLVCSDGLSEQQNPHRARFDSELSALRLGTVQPTSAAVSTLTNAFATFRGDQAVSDDITLICVRVLTAAERG